ncbi:hypothetical protein [uncultured Winogradskyella sp.]|uniref:hypothetical protein n=1 Tax=uncultured Winogradskyella sp. TaxID=395353 RepID=UPI0030DC8629|tara:strand:- start:62 stop:592 length:531 start_codon:yes stop_codon:yes gene_type:complete
MKILFSLFALIMVTESCNSTKEVVSNSKESEPVVASKPSKEMPIKKSDIVKDNYNKTTVIYKAMSRGTFEYIQISELEVLISSDRNLIEMNAYKYEKKDWDDLSRLIKEIDVEAFQKLKAPTDKRLFDGAAHTTLSLIKGDLAFITPSFDDGHPPKVIEELVNKVLSIKESAIKQK